MERDNNSYLGVSLKSLLHVLLRLKIDVSKVLQSVQREHIKGMTDLLLLGKVIMYDFNQCDLLSA